MWLLPYSDGAVVRAGDDARAVGGPCYASDPLGVAVVGEYYFIAREKLASVAGVPHLHGLIIAG